MSKVKQTTDSSDQYDFHTAEKDGETVCGIALIAGDLYEFINPETHEKRAKYRNPRTGEIVTHDSIINEAMAKMVRAIVLASEWQKFRTEYVSGEDRSNEEWIETFREVADEDTPAYF